MRQKNLLTKLLLLVTVMIMGAGAAWADTTYKLTQVTSVEADGLYVFEQDGHVMNNTVSSNALQTTTTYSVTGLSGTESYVWTLEETDGGFYLKNVSLNSNSYLNNGSSTNVTFGNKSSVWTIAFTDGVALISNTSNSNRFLGYKDATSYVYKAYATSNLSTYPHAITVYKLEEEADMTDSNLALSGAPVTLTFDLYNNSNAQVISFTTSSTGAVTVSESEYVNCVVSANTITVTPLKVTPSAQTITVSQAADNTYRAGTATFTVSVDDSTPIPTHTVTFSINGVTNAQDFEEGATITFPENPADIEGKSFVGWAESAIDGTTDETPAFVTSATMGNADLIYYAVFAKIDGEEQAESLEITADTEGVPSSYGTANAFSECTLGGVKFQIMQMYKNNNNLQWRAAGNNNGTGTMYNDENLGKITSIILTYDSGDSNKNFTLKVGSSKNPTDGTEITPSINGDEYTFDCSSANCGFFVLTNGSGAGYLDNLVIYYSLSSASYSGYCTTVAADTRDEAGISFAKDAVTAEIVDNYTGQTLSNPNNVSPITWTSSNEAVATVEDGTVTVLAVGETTIKASFAGDETYKKAEVSYTLTVQDSRQAIDLSFAETSVTVNITETVVAPTLNGNTGNGAVTYESSDETIAAVDAAGVVSGVAVGTATITATVAATNEYLGGTATFTVKVVDPNANDGSSVEKAFTVAEAIDVIKALPNTDATTEKYYIKGIVSSFQNTSIVGDGTNYRYFISDDGTTTTELQVYKGKGLDEATFTNANDLLVGDEVVIYGPIQYYKGTTPEIADGNYLVSLTRPVDTTPSITIDPVTVAVDAGENYGTLALTYANLTITGMDDFDIQYYNAEGGEVDGPDWIEALVAEQDPSVGEGYVLSYVVEANNGDARTAYLKVYALDDDANVVYSDLITISQEAYVAPEVTIGNFVKVTSKNDITSGQYLIVYEDGGVAFDGSRDDSDDKLDAVGNTIEVTIENGKIAATATNAKSVFNIDVATGTLQSASGKYIGVTSNSNGLKTSDNPEAYAHTFSIDDEENVVIAPDFDGSSMTLRYNYASNQARFRYYSSGQQAIQLYKFVADAENAEVTVTGAGYATYCSENDLDFSNTAIKAYKATISGTEVSFKEVKQVPAGEGVLLKANEGTYAVPVAAYAAANTDNAFIGVTEETVVDPGIFVLLNGNKGVGFYKTTKAFTVGANTAYLPALAGGAEGARSFIGFDNMVTAIEGIAAEKMLNGEVYNLQGQRMVAPQKGLYIVNGKKVVIK